MRQLLSMARARQRDDWTRMSNLLSLVYNINRGEKSPQLSPNDFNPFAIEAKQDSIQVINDPKEAAEIFKAMAIVKNT